MACAHYDIMGPGSARTVRVLVIPDNDIAQAVWACIGGSEPVSDMEVRPRDHHVRARDGHELQLVLMVGLDGL